MKTILTAILLSFIALTTGGCRSTATNPSGPTVIEQARQKLEELPEPTFESLEVYTHDLSAKGVSLLVVKYPDSKIPLRVLSDSAISVLEKETITMVDVVALSSSLDEIKEGKVKIYLDLAWTLLELNGVIRRNDLTAQLTVREQRLLLALFYGIKLGTSSSDEVEKILNGYGPRYTTNLPPTAGK
jgi:hypothetical protein